MAMRLAQDFKEFLRLLNSEMIEYLLVGGYAVSYHGYVRPTGDLDIWIAIGPESARKMCAALGKFGFATDQQTQVDLATPGKIIRMGLPPVRIEVLTRISGVEFQTCYSRRVEGSIDGVPAKIISREDLVTNKTSAGRHKDLNDIEQLTKPPRR